MPKRVKPWWFTAENGKLALHVRYGSRALELAKGKFAIEVASDRDLAATLVRWINRGVILPVIKGTGD